MESAKLYIEIDNIIRRNLQYAYNKNTQKVAFNLPDTFPNEDLFNFYNFSVNIETARASFLKQSHWRIPQTRFYFSTLNDLDFKISEIRYFNASVVLIKNYANHTLRFPYQASGLLYEANGKKYIKKDITLSAKENLILFCNGLFNDSESIITVLNQLIDKERRIHPLAAIFSTDVNLLKSIDTYWAEIHWASPDEVINNVNSKTTNETISALVSELSLFTTLNLKDNQRLIITSGQAQQIWDILSLPALRFKLIYLIKSRPLTIISFLLAAYEYNFWWADKARDLVQDNIKQYLSSVSSLFNLLFTLKSAFNISYSKNQISVSNYMNNLPNSSYSLKTDLCSVRFVRSKDRSYTYADFGDLDTISIDKKARINFNGNSSPVKICPQTFQYSQDLVNKLTIHFDSVRLEIALAWKNFVVNYGKLRFKFLFKKNRYQISIKGDTAVMELVINEHKLSFDKGKYLKFYFTPGVQEAQYGIFYTDQNGRIINDQNTINPLILNATAQNKYGQIIENLHIRKRNSNKNRTLYPPGFGLNKINSDEIYDLIVPKNEMAVVQPGYNKSVLTKVLYTHSSILEERLCIFVKKEEAIESLRDEFYKTFGFPAEFQPLEEIRISFATENIVIADTPLSGELSGSFPWHDEILVKRSGQKKVIFFTENNFREWLTSFSV